MLSWQQPTTIGRSKKCLKECAWVIKKPAHRWERVWWKAVLAPSLVDRIPSWQGIGHLPPSCCFTLRVLQHAGGWPPSQSYMIRVKVCTFHCVVFQWLSFVCFKDRFCLIMNPGAYSFVCLFVSGCVFLLRALNTFNHFFHDVPICFLFPLQISPVEVARSSAGYLQNFPHVPRPRKGWLRWSLRMSGRCRWKQKVWASGCAGLASIPTNGFAVFCFSSRFAKRIGCEKRLRMFRSNWNEIVEITEKTDSGRVVAIEKAFRLGVSL